MLEQHTHMCMYIHFLSVLVSLEYSDYYTMFVTNHQEKPKILGDLRKAEVVCEMITIQ